MPRCNGIQLIERVKAFIEKRKKAGEDIQEPTFIILTAYKTEQLERHCETLNIKHVYQKPIELRALREILTA